MKVAPLFHALSGWKEPVRSRRRADRGDTAEARYVLSSEENPFHEENRPTPGLSPAEKKMRMMVPRGKEAST